MGIDTKTKKSVIEHIKEHNDYPATKGNLVEACNGMSEFTKDQKRWFEKTLPDKKYENPNEVIKALGW